MNLKGDLPLCSALDFELVAKQTTSGFLISVCFVSGCIDQSCLSFSCMQVYGQTVSKPCEGVISFEKNSQYSMRAMTSRQKRKC